MIKELEKNYSYQNFGDTIVENTMFVNCVFVQSCFDSSQFINCSFVACNFSLSSFKQSHFERCVFKGCDFIHSFMDFSEFKDCNLSMCNFHSADFDKCKFGVKHSEHCVFTQVTTTNQTHIPATSREFVGAIIKQISDNPRIQAFGAFVTQCPDFCWETLTAIGEQFLTKEEVLTVDNELHKFPNFANLLNKYLEKKGLSYGCIG